MLWNLWCGNFFVPFIIVILNVCVRATCVSFENWILITIFNQIQLVFNDLIFLQLLDKCSSHTKDKYLSYIYSSCCFFLPSVSSSYLALISSYICIITSLHIFIPFPSNEFRLSHEWGNITYSRRRYIQFFNTDWLCFFYCNILLVCFF